MHQRGMVVRNYVIHVDIFACPDFHLAYRPLPIRANVGQIVRCIQPEYPMFSNTFKAAGLGIAAALAFSAGLLADPID